jgi:glycosyltransferase involved in cell wall biosynthesis
VNVSKTLLMVAFEFPPSNGASVPRTDSFYRYLKQWGWKVIVLTAKSHAYVNIDNTYKDNTDDLIYRTTAFDVQRQLSFQGKYLEVIATPDRWGLTWIPSAIIKGRQLVKKYRPDVIWSSSPIPSTHYIANKLATKGAIPWVADYRDPFHYMNGSAGQWLDKFHKRIDQTTLKNAAHLTFATSAVKDLYQSRYKDLISEKSTVIENGFDEANFHKLEHLEDKATPFADTKFTLYYCGVLYPNGRDPIPIFKAISALQDQGIINRNNFELIFQGAGDGHEFTDTINKLKLQELIKFIEPVPFIKALNNMIHADALLLIQDGRFNKQIPGKVYEYLRTQKPLLMKADPKGETAKLAMQFPEVEVAYTPESITKCLTQLIEANVNDSNNPTMRNLKDYNREGKARVLHDILGKVASLP